MFRESNKREKTKKAGWLLINDDGLMVKTVTLHFGMGRKGDNTYQHSMLDEMKKVQFRMSSPSVLISCAAVQVTKEHYTQSSTPVAKRSRDPNLQGY